jgi:uncharacterized repeat protein (TIGR03943 family)
LLLVLAPPAIGSVQADRTGTMLAQRAGASFPDLAPGDPVRLAVVDYAARAVFDQSRSLAGRRITLAGFITPGTAGEPYLARMVLGCCAAGAQPVKIGLTGNVPAGLVPDQWLEVQGSYTDRVDRDPVNGGPIPYLQVVSSRDLAAPSRPYES